METAREQRLKRGHDEPATVGRDSDDSQLSSRHVAVSCGQRFHASACREWSNSLYILIMGSVFLSLPLSLSHSDHSLILILPLSLSLFISHSLSHTCTRFTPDTLFYTSFSFSIVHCTHVLHLQIHLWHYTIFL